MRVLLVSVVSIVLLAAVAVFAQDEKPRCEQCGMFYEKSPVQVEATIKAGDKESTHIFEGLGCMHGYMADNFDGEAELVSLKILDFNTFGTDKPVMLNAMKAAFLVDMDPIKGSMAPFIAAFASEKTAEAAIASVGGKLATYEEVMASFAKKDVTSCPGSCAGCKGCPKGEASANAQAYVCPCTGDCCTDILSDKPGECPKCGMELVKKAA